jgi:anti-sigma factor RsiW
VSAGDEEHVREHDALRRDTGAYVLGALGPAERDRLEVHLERCGECRDEVAELAVLPGLLRGLRPEDVATAQAGLSTAEPSPPSEALQRIADERRRGRWRARLALIAAAMLAVVAATVAVLPGLGADGRTYVAAEVDAAATVVPEPWGMRVEVSASGLPEAAGYVLYAVDADGHRAHVASWTHLDEVELVGACYMEEGRLEHLELVTAVVEEVTAVLLPER